MDYELDNRAEDFQYTEEDDFHQRGGSEPIVEQTSPQNSSEAKSSDNKGSSESRRSKSPRRSSSPSKKRDRFGHYEFKFSKNEEAEPTRRLYLAGVSDDITEDRISEIFAPMGPIDEVYIPFPKRGYAFVEYQSVEHAIKAVEELKGLKFDGRPCHVKFALPRANKVEDQDRPQVKTAVWIACLRGYEEEEIRKEFERFGKVEDMKFMKSEDPKFKFQAACVFYDSEQSATSAIAAMNGKRLRTQCPEMIVRNMYEKEDINYADRHKPGRHDRERVGGDRRRGGFDRRDDRGHRGDDRRDMRRDDRMRYRSRSRSRDRFDDRRPLYRDDRDRRDFGGERRYDDRYRDDFYDRRDARRDDYDRREPPRRGDDYDRREPLRRGDDYDRREPPRRGADDYDRREPPRRGDDYDRREPLRRGDEFDRRDDRYGGAPRESLRERSRERFLERRGDDMRRGAGDRMPMRR